MASGGMDEINMDSDRPEQAHAFADSIISEPLQTADGMSLTQRRLAGRRDESRRRTPRVSVIVVLPENHVVSPDRLASGLKAHENQDVDIVVACAGQPTNLSALQRSVGDAQFFLAPAGTSTEDLREMAMRQAPGDIVTLLSGSLLRESTAATELYNTR